MDIKKTKKYLNELIEAVEKNIVNNEVQLFIYEEEVKSPTHIGLEEAKKGVEIYKKSIQHLEANLTAYKIYQDKNL